jgi:uncharacterized protein YlbG (UPF0298 family)
MWSVMSEFKIQRRRLLAIWLYNMRQMRNLRKFGRIFYSSYKMQYCLIYLDEENFDQTQEKIQRLHFVRRTQRSYRPDIEMNFAAKVGTKALDQLSKESVSNDDAPELKTKIRLASDLN